MEVSTNIPFDIERASTLSAYQVIFLRVGLDLLGYVEYIQ